LRGFWLSTGDFVFDFDFFFFFFFLLFLYITNTKISGWGVLRGNLRVKTLSRGCFLWVC
jgi:hypothetical protein